MSSRWRTLSGGGGVKVESVHPAPSPAPVDMEAWSGWVEMLVALETRRDEWTRANRPLTRAHVERLRDRVRDDVVKQVSSRSDEASEALARVARAHLAALDEAMVARARIETPSLVTTTSPFGDERLQSVSSHVKVLEACREALDGLSEASSRAEALEKRLEAETRKREMLEARLGEVVRERDSAAAASQAKVSHLEAARAEACARIDRETSARKECERRLRVTRDAADVTAAACAARTADADMLKAAVEDAEVRVRDATRRAVAAEEELRLEDEGLKEEVRELKRRLELETCQSAQLTAMRVGLERSLDEERAKRREAQEALRHVFKDVVDERARADAAQARTSAVEPELEALRHELSLLRGKTTALESALAHHHRLLHDPGQVTAVVVEEMDAMRRNYEQKAKDARTSVEELHANNLKIIQRLESNDQTAARNDKKAKSTAAKGRAPGHFVQYRDFLYPEWSGPKGLNPRATSKHLPAASSDDAHRSYSRTPAAPSPVAAPS